MYTGELISLGVAISWTFSALFFEHAGKRMGSIVLNIYRLAMAIGMSGITLLIFTGAFVPLDAGYEAWLWLGISGLIGYVLGDYCLFNAYILIGSRFGQLFMTLAPPSAALTGLLILHEQMSAYAIVGMFITLFGIGLSIVGRTPEHTKKLKLKLPFKGILFGVGAGVGQGVGLVFSKLGMDYYTAAIDVSDATTAFLLPFASTQIRAVVGIAGFLVMLLWNGNRKAFAAACKDGKAMSTTAAGTFFGPFVGVAFSLMAVQYTEAGIASTLMALTPILILLPSYFYYKQKVTAKETIGAIISVIGVSLFFMTE
jgi:drug/metabolite transporter (DMT)-like permease